MTEKTITLVSRTHGSDWVKLRGICSQDVVAADIDAMYHGRKTLVLNGGWITTVNEFPVNLPGNDKDKKDQGHKNG